MLQPTVIIRLLVRHCRIHARRFWGPRSSSGRCGRLFGSLRRVAVPSELPDSWSRRRRRFHTTIFHVENVQIFTGERRAFRNLLLEHFTQISLHKFIILFADALVEPVRVRDVRTRVLYALQSRGNADDFLNRSGETSLVVLPIDHLSHVWHFVIFARNLVLRPLFQVSACDGYFGVENTDRNGALRRRGAERFLRNDVLAHETLVFDQIGAEELRQTIGSRDRRRFTIAVLDRSFTHDARLRNVLQKLVVFKVRSLRLEHVEPTITDGSDSLVHFVERFSFQEEIEHFTLENLDQLEFTATFELETFQLDQLVLLIEHRVTLFDEHALLFRRRQNHRLVRPVDFKLNTHLRARFVTQRFTVFISHESLVLIVRVLNLRHVVEHDARVRNFIRLVFPLDFKAIRLRESSRQTAPDSIRVQLERLTDVVH